MLAECVCLACGSALCVAERCDCDGRTAFVSGGSLRSRRHFHSMILLFFLFLSLALYSNNLTCRGLLRCLVLKAYKFPVRFFRIVLRSRSANGPHGTTHKAFLDAYNSIEVFKYLNMFHYGFFGMEFLSRWAAIHG